MSALKSLLRAVMTTLYLVMVGLVLLEVALRIYPQAIPLQLLYGFEPELRATIARRLDLPVQADMVRVPRDDAGPPLRIHAPGAEIHLEYRDEGTAFDVTMDANGFCNPPGAAGEADLDVVIVGDSIAHCTGVAPDETFSAQFLARTGQAGFAMAAFPAGLYEYLQLLKVYGLDRQPRLVVLVAAGGNDLRDAYDYHEAVRSAAAADSVAEEDETGGWLARNSYSVNTSWQLLGALGKWIKLRIKLATSGLVVQDFRYTLVHDGQSLESNPDNADLDEVDHARRVRAGELSLDVFDEALVRFKELADENDFVPVVIYIPSAYSAYVPNVRFADPELQELMPWFMDQQGNHIGAKSRDLGIRFIDMTPVLRRAAMESDLSQPLYFPVNRHLTPLGHRVVAGELARRLGAMDDLD